MKKNLLKMALLAFATFAASVASAQTYSGKITSSDWPEDKGLGSDVDYSLTYKVRRNLILSLPFLVTKKSMLHISLQSMALVKLK